MRRADHLLKTMTAVRSCISNCRSSDDPFTALENYLQDLRLKPDWNADEIAEVESAARRALQSCASAASASSGRSAITVAATSR